MVNFEIASSSSLQDFPKRSFCDSEIGDSSGGMNAIYSQPKVADDVISMQVETTLWFDGFPNMWVASFSSFRENRNPPFAKCADDDRQI